MGHYIPSHSTRGKGYSMKLKGNTFKTDTRKYFVFNTQRVKCSKAPTCLSLCVAGSKGDQWLLVESKTLEEYLERSSYLHRLKTKLNMKKAKTFHYSPYHSP